MAEPISINFRILIRTSNNEGSNSLVNGRIGWERMVHRVYLHNGRHKTRNGWYLGMVAPISSILSVLIYILRMLWTGNNQAIALMVAYLEHLRV